LFWFFHIHYIASWNAIEQGKGCACCHGKQVGNNNSLAAIYPKLKREWNYDKNKTLTPYNVTVKSNKKVWWTCHKCGHDWAAKISDRSKGSNCPICNESHGERRVTEYLITHNYSECQKINNCYLNYYIRQMSFDNLVGVKGNPLSYDFYFPNQNLLIEYQGQFHDGTARFQDEKDLNIQQEHDRRKKEYAKKQGIDLLEIWYWDFDNIEKILDKEVMFNG